MKVPCISMNPLPPPTGGIVDEKFIGSCSPLQFGHGQIATSGAAPERTNQMSMLPIVEKLEQAPEKGDAKLRQAHGCFDLSLITDRQFWWNIDSIGGWNTTAHGPLQERGQFLAPTAEAAIEKFHQSEACPFGMVELISGAAMIDLPQPNLQFVRSEEYGCSPIIGFIDQLIVWGRLQWGSVGARTLHALLGEVISFQAAERAGTRDSRIHKALDDVK